ncbi:MAG: thioesterase family protein [Marmoricola sp.]
MSAPRRSDFVVWRHATTRWADDDAYGHLNNARYFEFIDTAVNAHLALALGTDIRKLPHVAVVAEVSCRYFAELGYPTPLDLGLAVERVGRSSVIYRVGIFAADGDDPDQPANAEGRFVHVYVDNRQAHRPPVPIPDDVHAVIEPLVRPVTAW